MIRSNPSTRERAPGLAGRRYVKDKGLAAPALLAHPVGQCRIQVLGVRGEPLLQRAYERSPQVRLAGADAAQDATDGPQHGGMLPAVAVATGEIASGHPMLFLAEVHAAMPLDLLQQGNQSFIRCGLRNPQQALEFSVDLVHRSVAQRGKGGRFDCEHRCVSWIND